MAEPAHQLNDDSIYDTEGNAPSDSKPDLKALEGGGETTEPKRGHLSEAGTAEPSREQLSKAEESSDTSGESGGSSFYRPSNAVSRYKLGGFKNRKALIGGLVALILLGLPLALFLLFGAYKLHHLSLHLEQRVARSARQLNQNADKVLEEKAAIDAGDTTAADLASQSFLGKSLDLVHPDRVISRMESSNVLDFKYTKGKLTAVVIDGESIDAPQLKLGQLFSNRQAKIDFYNRIYDKVDQSLRDTTSYQIRSRVGKAIIAKVGGHLWWWQNNGASEAAESPAQAELDEQSKLFKYVDSPSGGAVTDGIDSTASQAYNDAEKCLQDNACATKVLEGQPLLDASNAGADINNYVNDVSLKSAIGQLSIIYSILLPACMIYDGSVESSQAIVAAQHSAAIKAYLAITSADSQAISGGANGAAVGAFNKLLGNISDTNPEKMARGEAIDTTSEPYSQATRAQTYTIFGDITGSSIFYKIKGLCGDILSPVALAAALGIELCVSVCTSFEGTGEELALRDAATLYVKQLVNNVWERFLVAKEGLKNNALKFVFKNGAILGGTVGLTYLAKMLVTSEMGALVNGDQADYVNTADEGGVILNDNLSRQQNFGRPMTPQETTNSGVADAQYLNHLNGQESVFQRYFALSNPNSLLSNEAVAISGAINQPHKLVNAFLNIPRNLASSFRVLSSKILGHAVADTTTDTTHYNQVEWGWTNDEESLINGNGSFDPLENAQILDASGQSKAITDMYGKCFSVKWDDASNQVVPDDSVTIDSLLSDTSAIHRDPNTGVVDGGLCSPSNLSYNNNKFGPMMVFRWRLDQSYQSAVNELSDIQNTPAVSASP